MPQKASTFPLGQVVKIATFPPKRSSYQEVRSREYLSAREVDDLLFAIKKDNLHGQRNYTIALLMFRHGLRLSETCNLKWEQLDLIAALFHVKRIKNGVPSTHPLQGSEIRALRRLQSSYAGSPYVFITSRKTPLSGRSIMHMIVEGGKRAKLPFPIHPHMLRHSCGFYLANKGVDTRAIQLYLGHSDINNTVKYTALSPQRFNGF